MSEVLLSEREGATLHLTLNRPEKMNALSALLVDALLAETRAAATSGVRLLVLKSNGRNFSAGFDFSGYDEQSDGDLLLRFVRIEQLLQEVYHAPFETMALAHGKNFGAGVDLICSCSRRVGDAEASFRMPGLGFGLVLGTRRFSERVGADPARRILGEGSSFTADQAVADGFLTGVLGRDAWGGAVAEAAQVAAKLESYARAALNQATCKDTRAADLADLVASAARPGLKDRIRDYRSQSGG